MATIVELPRLSDTMEEGVIAKWHIAEGDKVKRGQVIADIETDKATMEFESFDAGTVLKIVAPEGETLPLGAPIAVFGKPGEDAEEALAGKGGKAKKAKKAEGEGEAGEKAKKAEKKAKKTEKKGEKKAQAEARETVEPSEPEPELPRESDRIAASPLARRLAREHGLRLSDIEGSGPNGRIVKADVDAAAESGPSVGRPETVVEEGEDVEVELSQMRKTIARRMSQANSEIPHFYLSTTIAMDRAVELREQLKDAIEGVKISFNDLVIMAAAKGLVEHPAVNAYWNGKTIVRRGNVHMGIAVAVEEGLVVPVIRHADKKALRVLSAGARDLGTRARDKKLSPQEMSGSTFTVSNLGMFGIDQFAAVINPGEGAILAVGAITDEVVVVDGQIGVGKRMKATIACDHRVMDGATGARFLGTFRRLLEQPLEMLA
jgi:pyruvate dehydrogenase E2 component (dihydrolipoamide acetyltransferase)